MKKPKSIDAYIRAQRGPKRKALVRLRKQILSIVPSAEECISYGMPAFRLDKKKIVAGFLATRTGCSYYPFSGRTLRTLAKDLRAYSKTPGALHFDPAKGLPLALVRKLIRTRRAEK